MREMVGGCCVCSDERGWDENPLVYCDGPGCNVAVHQACYGIVSVPTGPWYCRKCESQERSSKVRCELCPNREGALKRTDNESWAHVVCALYIPEVRFRNVSTMEPIMLGLIPQDRYIKTCYICERDGRESKSSTGACMTCNKPGCKQSFHVTCAQSQGFLCEEAGNYLDNVKYCGYCDYHYQKINKKMVKTIPAFRSILPSESEEPIKASVEPPKASPSASSTSSSSSMAHRKTRKGRVKTPNSLDPSKDSESTYSTDGEETNKKLDDNKLALKGAESVEIQPSVPAVEVIQVGGKPKSDESRTSTPLSTSTPSNTSVTLTLASPSEPPGAAITPPKGETIYSKSNGLSSSGVAELQVNNETKIEPIDEYTFSPEKAQGTFGTKRLGRPSKKGTHIPNNSVQVSMIPDVHKVSPPPKSESFRTSCPRPSPASSPEVESASSFSKKRKKAAAALNMSNGQGPSDLASNSTNPIWMMGTTLNPASAVAKEMGSVLQNEILSHSAFDLKVNQTLVGVPLPVNGSTSKAKDDFKSNRQPNTLEELLERQWEQGSQFLMDQSAHFDIASLLSSLNQLKEDNLNLEESVNQLIQRRDHLLAIRARLMLLSSSATASNVGTSSISTSKMESNGPKSQVSASKVSLPPVRVTSTVSGGNSGTLTPLVGPSMTIRPSNNPPSVHENGVAIDYHQSHHHLVHRNDNRGAHLMTSSSGQQRMPVMTMATSRGYSRNDPRYACPPSSVGPMVTLDRAHHPPPQRHMISQPPPSSVHIRPIDKR